MQTYVIHHAEANDAFELSSPQMQLRGTPFGSYAMYGSWRLFGRATQTVAVALQV